jgi:hypothetical protein
VDPLAEPFDPAVLAHDGDGEWHGGHFGKGTGFDTTL